MAGRALAFSDPEIVRMATEQYVSVTGDDWYQRRREDAEGEFFRRVADQGPRKGEGGSTRQGIYCLTADGTLLAYRNAAQPEVMREVLAQGLRAWAKLPESRRAPGAVRVGEPGKVDERYHRAPPRGGLVVNVYARCLDRRSDGTWCDAACTPGRGDEASRDHLWITEAEWKSLAPAQPRAGDRVAMPPKLVERILRFHLIDNTRGEPDMWRREDIRASDMTLTVDDVSPKSIRLRLDGTALLATRADPDQAERGYDVRLLGYIQFDRTSSRLDRFDVVAVGDHWGHSTYTSGARPGRTPLGVAFELARGDVPSDRVPPQAARSLSEYFGGRN